MEYFEIYDALGHSTNKQVPRGTPLKPNEYFMVVHVWIVHSNGTYLIQKRAKTSDPIPYQWAITTGGALVKETALDAALREVKEELGLTITKTALNKLETIVSKRNAFHTITHVYLVEQDVDLNTLTLDASEVQEVAYASLDTIKTMIKDKLFWDYPYLLNAPNYFNKLESRR